MDDVTKDNSLRALWRTSPLAGNNAPYLERLYEGYLLDPESVPPGWRRYFENLPRVNGPVEEVPHSVVRDYFRRLPRQTRGRRPSPTVSASEVGGKPQQVRVLQLINAYRFRGHQWAQLNPLERWEPPDIPELTLEHHGLSEADYDCVFETGSLVGPKRATLREVLAILTQTYCGHLGVEYMHITDTAEKRWIQQWLEGTRATPAYATEDRHRILGRLISAEGLEHYLHSKYAGQKRFSLEGAESLIPLLDELIQRGGLSGVKELVIGMAHRGRLNVLVNILGKTPAELFMEFEGRAKANGTGTGDVKYHLGYSSDISTAGGPIHVALAFNPSHLEIVAPVVEGSVRARQERRRDADGGQVVSLLIHGDAAFAGQGVVMETFNMSQSRGFSTKGTVHIIVNNQIGFTTSQQQDARSTLYSSDVAKMVNAPIFHVNADDPEAVAFVAQLALNYRMTYRKDVVIDLVCYRRHGHSEADEPTVTQPLMYQRIQEQPTCRALYAQKLIDEGQLDIEQEAARRLFYRQSLDAGDCVAPEVIPKHQTKYPYAADWTAYLVKQDTLVKPTRVALEVLRELSDRFNRMPEGFQLHPIVAKVFDNRRKMAAGAMPIDWGFAETMAYATLLKDGFGIRLSGQDSGRGTFFHRHAIVYNQKNGTALQPLQHLFEDQPEFRVINSLLSEEAVLAFEYGYATANPNTLTVWEAQFGDFANNAQVVIDQFISTGEQKWGRLCGLVMFLPHGYEGQGPEHSSARLERYLQLCAQHNMCVCVPTTAAQMFHLLRRQMLHRQRKPLIVMTPKSLLRHRLAVSALEDLTQGEFKPVLGEADDLNAVAVERVVLCGGKVYYDLLEKRREYQLEQVAIVRVEQYYPFPTEALKQELARFPNAREFVWCQEEPKNQGAWYSSQHHMRAMIPQPYELGYAGRPMSASPAVGYYALHVQQQRELVDAALGRVS